MFQTLYIRASKDSIFFETRVWVFSIPTVTSPSPDSSLNSYTHDYLFWAHKMKMKSKLLKLCSILGKKCKRYEIVTINQSLLKNQMKIWFLWMPKNGIFHPFQQWFWTHLDLGSNGFQTRVWVPTLDSGTRVSDSSLDALLQALDVQK